MALLDIRDVSRSFDGVLAVDNVSFHIEQGETVSVIGPNGAGKTTLFNIITGVDQPTSGEVVFDGQPTSGLAIHDVARLGLARTFQHGRVFANLSILDNVLIGAHSRRQVVSKGPTLASMVRELWYGLHSPAHVRREEQQLRAEAEEVLLQFGDRLSPRLNQPAYTLSYANRRRVEIARALLLKPRLLLLDEPTAGMNPSETDEMLELIARLKASGQTILLIEHKLSLVMRLSDRVIVMDDGQVITEGAPEVVRYDPRVIEAYLGHRRHAAELAPHAANVAHPITMAPLAIEPSTGGL